MIRSRVRHLLPWFSLARPHAPHRRAFTMHTQRSGDSRPLEGLNIAQLAKQRKDYERARTAFLAGGALAGLASLVYAVWKLGIALNSPTRLDSTLSPTDTLVSAAAGNRKVVVYGADGREIVPTGNPTVPDFPRTLDVATEDAPADDGPSISPVDPLPPALTVSAAADTAAATIQYTLVGLGLRTVSFLSIQVYVVGYYIATSDIAALQSALAKKINPIATTLVAGEKDQLRNALLDPVEGEKTWDALLKDGIPARSIFRIVPVRDTDFRHLRDGFVRSVQARVGALDSRLESDVAPADFDDAMRRFRQIFHRGSVPKKRELLLLRDQNGRLSVAYDDGAPAGRQIIGVVDDERVSRALWLNYLAGKKVASELARKSIVEGVMEFVERPVGTVAAQVV